MDCGRLSGGSAPDPRPRSLRNTASIPRSREPGCDALASRDPSRANPGDPLRRRAGLLLVLGGVLAGCGDDDVVDSYVVPEGCNPLAADVDCLLPYPSDFFLVDDPSMPSGKRLSIADVALPHTRRGVAVDSTVIHPGDGFSQGTQILAHLPGAVDPENLVGYASDQSASVADASPTLLIDAATGERIMHLAEMDPRPRAETDRALVIRPFTRLENGARYVVAVRRLSDRAGMPVPPPEGFRRIRDRVASAPASLAALAARYERDVFPVLERAGVARGELELAWDFTIGSEENVTRDMLAMRADLLPRLAATPPPVTVVDVMDAPMEHVGRLVHATIRVPLYMETAEPGASLHRGADGTVTANGEVDVPVTVLVPTSVMARAAGSPPVRVVQFGHGFFGSRYEIEGAFGPVFADRAGVVLVACDWWGMSDGDLDDATTTIVNDMPRMLQFTDRLHQGMANQLALAAAAGSTIAAMPDLQQGGAPLLDGAHLYYYGISNGHILGGTYVALAPRIERAVLGSGGASYTFVMFRARPFSGFLGIMQTVIPGDLDLQKHSVLLQTVFDRIDPSTYAPHVLTDTFPGSPASRRVLMHAGLWDTSVPTIGTEQHARMLGLPVLTPSPRMPPGLATVTAPHDGSALVEFDFHVDPDPTTQAIPPRAESPVHNVLRLEPTSMDQVDRFLREGGVIEQICDGPCDPG